MVNVLHEYYIENKHLHGGVENTYRLYGEIINESLLDPKLKDEPRKKWEWFKEYHAEATRNL